MVDNAGLDEAAMRRSPFFHASGTVPLEKVLQSDKRVLVMARKLKWKEFPVEQPSGPGITITCFFATVPGQTDSRSIS
jgi:hypothetical protein